MNFQRDANHDVERLKQLYNALATFRLLSERMPLQYVLSFLAVATEEGKGVGEYAKKLGFNPTTMSRHLLDIGPRARDMQKGYGLVDCKPNPNELRKHEYFLTAKGRQLIRTILGELDKVSG